MGFIPTTTSSQQGPDVVPNPNWFRRHSRCSLPWTSSICARRFKTRYVLIQCNSGTYSQTFFPSSILLWNTLAVYSCQLQCTSWHFRNQAHQFSFHLSTGLRPVLIACTAPFLSKVTVYFFAAWLSRSVADLRGGPRGHAPPQDARGGI